jgi:hypothetical protein
VVLDKAAVDNTQQHNGTSTIDGREENEARVSLSNGFNKLLGQEHEL